MCRVFGCGKEYQYQKRLLFCSQYKPVSLVTKTIAIYFLSQIAWEYTKKYTHEFSKQIFLKVYDIHGHVPYGNIIDRFLNLQVSVEITREFRETTSVYFFYV